MPLEIKGRVKDFYRDGQVLQPGWTVTEKNDGTLEGTAEYHCDTEDAANVYRIGHSHPKSNKLECYNITISGSKNHKLIVSCAYFGLTSSKTDPIISHTPNTNQDPITSHKDFSEFAGTKEKPLNGAEFDSETGEFLGFFDPENTDTFGVDSYLVPATLVSLTYWTDKVPGLKKQMTKVRNVEGFRKPDDVKEFMLISSPYRQVGSFYQVTEQYMGSGENGFSPTIYPQ